MNWPIGMGQQFKGIYELAADRLVCFEKSQGHHIHAYRVIEGLDSDEARELLGMDYEGFVDEIELVRGASHDFDQADFESATVSPVYFGTALGNFGVQQMLDGFVELAPASAAGNARSIDRTGRVSFFWVCFQNSGEHGSKTPRPNCVLTCVLGHLPSGYEGTPSTLG